MIGNFCVQGNLELVKLRHRFCNLYREDLDPVRTTEVQRKARALLGGFPSIHHAFHEKIRAIGERLP